MLNPCSSGTPSDSLSMFDPFCSIEQMSHGWSGHGKPRKNPANVATFNFRDPKNIPPSRPTPPSHIARRSRGSRRGPARVRGRARRSVGRAPRGRGGSRAPGAAHSSSRPLLFELLGGDVTGAARRVRRGRPSRARVPHRRAPGRRAASRSGRRGGGQRGEAVARAGAAPGRSPEAPCGQPREARCKGRGKSARSALPDRPDQAARGLSTRRVTPPPPDAVLCASSSSAASRFSEETEPVGDPLRQLGAQRTGVCVQLQSRRELSDRPILLLGACILDPGKDPLDVELDERHRCLHELDQSLRALPAGSVKRGPVPRAAAPPATSASAGRRAERLASSLPARPGRRPARAPGTPALPTSRSSSATCSSVSDVPMIPTVFCTRPGEGPGRRCSPPPRITRAAREADALARSIP